MFSSPIKDLKLRLLFKKHEKLAKVHKFLFVHLASRAYLTNVNDPRLQLQLKKLLFGLKFHSKIRIRSHCKLTGKTNGVYRPYYLSRMVLKELIEFGILPGYKKAVW